MNLKISTIVSCRPWYIHLCKGWIVHLWSSDKTHQKRLVVKFHKASYFDLKIYFLRHLHKFLSKQLRIELQQNKFYYFLSRSSWQYDLGMLMSQQTSRRPPITPKVVPTMIPMKLSVGLIDMSANWIILEFTLYVWDAHSIICRPQFIRNT